MSCPDPHPLRLLDTGRDVEEVGRYATDSWGRCRKCGRWFWLTTDDSSKWQYYDEWELDRALAERALAGHDAGGSIEGGTQAQVRAVAELLVSNDLPWGPVWTSGSALVELLRALTPSATDGERADAVSAAIAKGQPPLRARGDNRWLHAAKLLREVATHEKPTAPDLVFALDVTLHGGTFGEAHEIGTALVLVQTAPHHALVRIDAKAISELPVGGPVRFLADGPRHDAVLFAVATPEGEAICRVDGAGSIASLPASSTRYAADHLDDGWWLLVPDDADAVLPRKVELREPDARPKATLQMRVKAQGYACPPRRMGEGWVLAGCIDGEGTEHALTLVDASFKAVAQSTGGVTGQRLMHPIDARSLWCETVKYPFLLERWERRGDALERTMSIASQSWIRVEGGVVVKPRDVDAGIVGYDDAGLPRFHIAHETRGATYFAKAPNGLLVYDDARAGVIDPRTGDAVAPSLEIEHASVLGNEDVLFLRERAFLWVLGKERKRVFVGERMTLETTCGTDVLLRDDVGECLLLGSDGLPRGRFAAPNAQFSVVGTRGGPYVIEGARVRVARFS